MSNMSMSSEKNPAGLDAPKPHPPNQASKEFSNYKMGMFDQEVTKKTTPKPKPPPVPMFSVEMESGSDDETQRVNARSSKLHTADAEVDKLGDMLGMTDT
ncbi:hypothetical protein HBH53_246430 [Parastagonospora nodorum]|nr:hypothetical protein HBH53_246430 [Parastagonospora nodorum]KAH5993309.1 hypothetical protein HBI83_250320 [Parastagonospora nodorum]KAH6384396.1 hypothetical protein HBI60_244530 [Parastagonospora nodorum]